MKGWYRDNYRHSLAAKGIKTRYNWANSQIRSRAIQPKDICEKYWSFREEPTGGIQVSLGNMTDAGWYWSGDEKDLAGFAIRLADGSMAGEFANTMDEEVPLDLVRGKIADSVSTGSGLYEMSGDNLLWHFGEGMSDLETEEENSAFDSIISDKGWKMTRDLESKYADLINSMGLELDDYHDVTDFNSFEEDKLEEYKKDMAQVINESKNWKELVSRLSDLKEGWNYEANEWLMSGVGEVAYRNVAKVVDEIEKNYPELVEQAKFEAAGSHPSQASLMSYSGKWRDRLRGGLADKKTPSDFNKRQLMRGLKVELEHTSNRKIAKEIAMDHLTEDPMYYDKLERMEGK